MNEYAIIVAGGSGSRMQTETPKQFLELQGKPVLMHTLEVFMSYASHLKLVLVLPEASIPVWQDLCKMHSFHHPIHVVSGGKSRYQSVKNGLMQLPQEDSLVAIHDGVRPLVTRGIIAESFATAKAYGSAIAATPLKESIVEVAGDSARSIDRTRFRSIQTPQTFKTLLIREAYEQIDERHALTDDASVAEKFGLTIRLIAGSYENIKITTPEDLLLAESIMGTKK